MTKGQYGNIKVANQKISGSEDGSKNWYGRRRSGRRRKFGEYLLDSEYQGHQVLIDGTKNNKNNQ